MDWMKCLKNNASMIAVLLLILYVRGSRCEENKDEDAMAMYSNQFSARGPKPGDSIHNADNWSGINEDIDRVAEILRHQTKRNSDQVSKFGWGKRSLDKKRLFRKSSFGAKRQPNANGWGGAYGNYKPSEKRQNANAWGGAYGTEKRLNQNAWGGAYGQESEKRSRLNANAWGGAYGEAAEKRINANGWGGAYGAQREKR